MSEISGDALTAPDDFGVVTTWLCCRHCSCVPPVGHAVACGEVGCGASRTPILTIVR